MSATATRIHSPEQLGRAIRARRRELISRSRPWRTLRGSIGS